MNDVSLLRLYLLRALYLLVVVGLGATVWPSFLFHPKPWEAMRGVIACMLVAFSLLSLLGLRYPLQMLPVLLWELLWKAAWLLVIVLPMWSAGRIDAVTAAMVPSMLMVVIIPFILPWRYMYARYLKLPGDRWRRSA